MSIIIKYWTNEQEFSQWLLYDFPHQCNAKDAEELWKAYLALSKEDKDSNELWKWAQFYGRWREQNE